MRPSTSRYQAILGWIDAATCGWAKASDVDRRSPERYNDVPMWFERLEARQMLATVSAAWIGGTSGYWDVAADWSNDSVPSSATAVSIAQSGATVTIRSGHPASAGSVAIAAGDTLVLAGSSLTTAAGLTNSGSVLDWSTRYAAYESVLQQTVGSQASSVQVMATEYNSVWADPGKQSTSLVNGLFVADSLGSLLDSGYSGGFVWDLRNAFDSSQNNSNVLYRWREGGDYGQLGDPNDNSPPTTGPYVAYPGYDALQLASKIIQSGGEVVPATSNYSDLNV